MTRRKWLACGLAGVLFLGVSYAAGQDAGGEGEGKKAKRADRAGKGGGKKRGGRRPAFDYAAIGEEAGLTAEQTEKVTGLVLYYQFMLQLQRSKLDDDQKMKVKALCKDAAKTVLAAGNPREQGEALGSLSEKVKTDVLNEEQRSKFKPAFGGKRGKKADQSQ